MARLLCETDEDFSADVMGHVREHSIEVLLPFLQVCAGDAPLHVVPVCVGTGQAPVLRTAGQRLARVLERCRSRDGQRPLLLVSSDMNHYEDQQTTLRKDDLALDAALKGDADALLATVAREGISMCGAAPLALAFYALHAWAPDAAVRATLVMHETSAAVSHDTEHVVGYAGLRIFSC